MFLMTTKEQEQQFNRCGIKPDDLKLALAYYKMMGYKLYRGANTNKWAIAPKEARQVSLLLSEVQDDVLKTMILKPDQYLKTLQ